MNNPTSTLILSALTAATGLPETSFAFTYPVIRQQEGWTTSLTVPHGTPAPDVEALATALRRPASCVQVEAVGSLLFLTFHDTTPTYLQAA